MSYLHKIVNSKFKLIVCLSVLLIMVFAVIRVCLKQNVFYLNKTDSAPKGLYITAFTQDLDYGDYAIIHPDFVKTIYQNKNAVFLLKKVAGLPNDIYITTSNEIRINGTSYPIWQNPELPQQAPGRYIVPSCSILFLNDNPTSFDSRYVGPINARYIVTKVIFMFSLEPFEQLERKAYDFYKNI